MAALLMAQCHQQSERRSKWHSAAGDSDSRSSINVVRGASSQHLEIENTKGLKVIRSH